MTDVPFLRERLWAFAPELESPFEERYEYDDQGRVVVIHEAADIWMKVSDFQRWNCGGRLEVDYDAEGPLRIRSEHHVVWERVDEPWPQLLARGADAVAAQVVELVRGAGIDPSTEVYAMSLVYVDQGSLHLNVSFGREQDRRAAVAHVEDLHDLACKLMYVEWPDFLEDDVPSDDWDWLLLREAALNQPGDPYRVVLNAVAERLARHDWDGILTPTDDFVVWIAEHDEGFALKWESLRAVNPPERVALFEANWPEGAPQGEDELEDLGEEW